MRTRALALALAILLAGVSALAAQMLEQGATGETVKVLTRRLAELGYIAAATDEYGADVVSAVGDFQTANGIARTGVADLDTQQAMYGDDAVTRQAYMAAFIKKYAGLSLKQGDRSDAVKRLQAALVDLGYYSGAADGVFGEGTRRAVSNYQTANGLESTGVADASTLVRVFEGESVSRAAFIQSQTAQKGDAGSNVRSIQERLTALGYFKGDLTGTYGEMTERAVARFQAGNTLSQSGAVDAATYEALFSDQAVTAAGDGALYPGDTGDEVFTLQTRLSELGFFDGTPNGAYGRSTETSVMLFRAANGLDISSDATEDVLALAETDLPQGIEALADSADGIDRATLETICGYASGMVGEAFEEDAGVLFPGFGFVRYVFAQAGVAVTDPGTIISRVGQKAFSAEDIAPGDIVVLGRGTQSAMTLTFTVCGDAGMLVYVDAAAGAVASAAIGDMDFVSAYVWDFGVE